MTTSEYLANLGVTMQQAKDYIMANLGSPATIFNTCAQFGVTNQMLADIYGGVTADQVESFFDSQGLDGSLLNGTDPDTDPDTDTTATIPEQFQDLINLVTTDDYTTAPLSIQYLREHVLNEGVTTDEYWNLFDPDSYPGSSDGTLSAADLGFDTSNSDWANLPATKETVESLYYGTAIKALKALDMSEILEIQDFMTSHIAQLEAQDATTMDQFYTLLVDAYEDQATSPLFTDQMISDALIQGTALEAKIIGSNGDFSFIDGLVSAWG